MPSSFQRTIFGRSGTVRISDEAGIELPLQSHVIDIREGGPGAIPSDNHQAIEVEQNKLSSSVPRAANGGARSVPTYGHGVIELAQNTLKAFAAILRTYKEENEEQDEKKKLHDLGLTVLLTLCAPAISIYVAPIREVFSKKENDQLKVITILILFAQVLALALVLSSKIPGIHIEFLRVMRFIVLASAGVAITGFTCYLLLKFWIFVVVAFALFVVIFLLLGIHFWKKMRSSGRTP